MEHGAGEWGRRWWVVVLVGAALALTAGGFFLAFRGVDAVPGATTPAGAVIELRDYVEAQDYEGAQGRLCAGSEGPATPENGPVEVVGFFEDHDVELATPGDPGEVPADRDSAARDRATTVIHARPRDSSNPTPERWIVHLQRDPGGSGQLWDRSLRWLVCRLEPDTASRPAS